MATITVIARAPARVETPEATPAPTRRNQIHATPRAVTILTVLSEGFTSRMRITALFLLALGLACWHSLANPPLFITVLYTACTNQIALKDTWPLVSHCTLRCPIGIAARTRSVRGIASTPLADALGLYKLLSIPGMLHT